MRDFWQGGPPGWICPFLTTGFVLGTWLAAATGSPSANAFLSAHGTHIVSWMTVTMAPWLAYKGWKYHSDNGTVKAQIAAGVPAVAEGDALLATGVSFTHEGRR